MELTTTNILSLFETTKEQRQSFINDIIERVKEGEIDPLKIHLQLKCAEDIVKQITGDDTFKKEVYSAAEKYNDKSFQFMSAKFEKKEVGVKYDFSQCNDPVLVSLQQQADEAAKKLKARQDMLKTLPVKGIILTDEESGETFTAYPPSKSSTSSVAVTLL